MSAAAPRTSEELASQTTYQNLGPAARAIYDLISQATGNLDGVARQIWRAFKDEIITDAEAHYLSFLIERRRAHARERTIDQRSFNDRHYDPRAIRFPARRRQKSPDRSSSVARRRMLAASGNLPDTLRRHFTTGQLAVLCVVAGEVKRCGLCDQPLDEIAALAGVCRATAQSAMHRAQECGLICVKERRRRGRKNLTNVITIISPEWTTWIRRAPSAARRIGSNFAGPTKITDIDDSGRPSEEAISLADEFATIAGHAPQKRPRAWWAAQPERQLDEWLRRLDGRGLDRKWLLTTVAKYVMARKPDPRPPFSIRYFQHEVERVIRVAGATRWRCSKISGRTWGTAPCPTDLSDGNATSTQRGGVDGESSPR
jgi:hypothetical protein